MDSSLGRRAERENGYFRKQHPRHLAWAKKLREHGWKIVPPAMIKEDVGDLGRRAEREKGYFRKEHSKHLEWAKELRRLGWKAVPPAMIKEEQQRDEGKKSLWDIFRRKKKAPGPLSLIRDSLRRKDPYAGAKFTRANARLAIRHYSRVVATPSEPLAYRSYAATRLDLAKKLVPQVGRLERMRKLQAQAMTLRQQARASIARRDRAAATRYEVRAQQLDQEARSIEIRSAGESQEEDFPGDANPQAREALVREAQEELRTAPPGSPGAEPVAPEAEAEGAEGVEGAEIEGVEGAGAEGQPWYKRPAVWVVVALIAAGGVAAVVQGGKKGKKDKTKVFFAGARERPPAAATPAG